MIYYLWRGAGEIKNCEETGGGTYTCSMGGVKRGEEKQ